MPPDAPSTDALLGSLSAHLAAGRGVAVHCRMGLGRSAVITACLLVRSGRTSEKAFEQIVASRGFPVPDTDEQREWLAAFARQHAARKG